MITYKSSGTVKAPDNSTSVDAPDTKAVGDLIFILTQNNSSQVMTFPTGFAVIATVVQGISRTQLAWKRVEAGEDDDTSYTVTGGSVSFIAQAHCYGGALSSASPIRAFDADPALNADPSSSVSGLTANDMLISAVSNSSTIAMTFPGWNIRGGTVSRLMFADKVQPTDGASGTVTPTTSGLSRRTAQILVALVPEPTEEGGKGHVVRDGLLVPLTELNRVVDGVNVPLVPYVVRDGVLEPVL